MRTIKLAVFCLTITIVATSCLKQEHDVPPDTSGVDPMLAVNASIKDIADIALSLPSDKGRVLGDSTIYGIVIGDDRSGNIYKKIYIQDTNGSGINIIIDKTFLYGSYPVGRKVYVKLNGLYVFNYRGLPEITYDVDSAGNTTGIPSSLVSNFIVPASFPHTIKPAAVTIADLFSRPAKYLNTLVTLENMQFVAASANVAYSNANASTNRTISDCPFSGTLTMYNSSYATFQPAITPEGKGQITGIFTIYNSTPQFVLRDTSDVRFTEPRDCP